MVICVLTWHGWSWCGLLLTWHGWIWGGLCADLAWMELGRDQSMCSYVTELNCVGWWVGELVDDQAGRRHIPGGGFDFSAWPLALCK